ncbi:MAG: efflux transporter outer membrane subunit [Planctomycetes bacterium]|nr:efflux transporter outer membrane subunit [Planctomycetota bacterium]
MCTFFRAVGRLRMPTGRARLARPTLALVLLAGAGLAFTSGCTSLGQWARQCFKVGPDYQQPPAPVADEWIDFESPEIVSESSDYSNWWSVFGDPVLDRLIQKASRQNLTLQSAGMRILEARARLAVARGNLFPQTQQAFGDFTRINGSTTVANVFPANDFDNWDAGFNASWELDFWGRFRRAIESQEAILNAEIENYDSVLVILQAEVATAYIQYRTFQQRLQWAKENVELQKRTLEIVNVQFRNGRVTELDVAQAKENLAATEALIPQLESGLRQTANALCVLMGEPPRDLTEELGEAPIPAPPDRIFVGIPAELLRRRPDVRRAERLAAAQCAAIGIAESDLYPRIAITGYIGLESENLSSLFDSRSFIGAIGPGFRWNILNYGRIVNNVRANEAQFYKLVVDYQNTVLTAAREVEDAIVSYLKEKQRVQNLEESAKAAARAVELATTQYRQGKINFQPVVYMQQLLAARQDELAASRGAVDASAIAVYKALGGGWQARFAGPEMPTELAPAPAVNENSNELVPPEPEAP